MTAHHPPSLELSELGLAVLVEEEPEEALVEELVELLRIRLTQANENELVPPVTTVGLELVRDAAAQ